MMGGATSHTKKDAAVIEDLDEVKGSSFDTEKDSLEEIGGYINHLTHLFPTDTSLTATLTSGAQNVWGAWTRLVDSGAGYFDLEFTKHAHLTEIGIESEEAAGIYMMEIAYGAARTVVARVRWSSDIIGIFASVQKYRIRSPHIPGNAQIYGRVMCNVGAGTQIVLYNLRYYTH